MLGVRVALDDCGTGYASIGYLRELGFDSIKIDHSFVASSRGIVSLGDALSLPATAEGVETLGRPSSCSGRAALGSSAGCAAGRLRKSAAAASSAGFRKKSLHFGMKIHHSLRASVHSARMTEQC